MKKKYIFLVVLAISSYSPSTFSSQVRKSQFEVLQIKPRLVDRFWAWIFPESTLNQLTEQYIEFTLNKDTFIPTYTHRPNQYFHDRNQVCKQAYIDTFLTNATALQNSPSFKNKPYKIVKKAAKIAQNAENNILKTFDVPTWEKQQANFSLSRMLLEELPKGQKIEESKIAQAKKYRSAQTQTDLHVPSDLKIDGFYIEDKAPANHVYQIIPNFHSRTKSTVSYNQSNPHKIGNDMNDPFGTAHKQRPSHANENMPQERTSKGPYKLGS